MSLIQYSMIVLLGASIKAVIEASMKSRNSYVSFIFVTEF